MENNSVRGNIAINATPATVWNILTHPDKIVIYTGSQTYTDWAVGSPITWEGEMFGTKYVNRGSVLEKVTNKLLRFTYWSGMGGDPDLPENYSEITYTLDEMDDNLVELTYSRIKIATIMEQQIFQQHLLSMLQEIKRMAEE
jgi:uncharacterized protein YndB with AHSA1/START domain